MPAPNDAPKSASNPAPTLAPNLAPNKGTELIQHMLALGIVLVLLATCLAVLRPFLPAILWATMIVVATWPLMRGLQARLGGRRWAAATVMTVAMVLLFVIPLAFAIGALVRNIDGLAGWIGSVQHWNPGTPPEWLASIPFAGSWLDETWREIAASGDVGAQLAPRVAELGRWFAGQVGSMGAIAVQILLTIVVSALFYMRGETAAAGLRRFMARVAPRYGEGSVVLAGQAIRAVAMGLVVTAAVQSLIGGIGLAVAGVPLAAILTALMFLLALAQVGATPVMVLAALWMYFHGNTGWAVALAVWAVAVAMVDNFLRPVLIRRGADLPLVLIFTGVLGGLMSFGLVGLFIGPMVLAVTFRAGQAWSHETLAQ